MQSKQISFQFAVNEMRQHGDKIKAWATQNENLLLKQLANEVIAAAGEAR